MNIFIMKWLIFDKYNNYVYYLSFKANGDLSGVDKKVRLEDINDVSVK